MTQRISGLAGPGARSCCHSAFTPTTEVQHPMDTSISPRAPFHLSYSLPLELLLAIVDEIPNHDISSLQACSVVCRGLVQSCQTQIFSRISLKCIHLRERLKARKSTVRFLNIISYKPELASYVRELEFSEDDHSSQQSLFEDTKNEIAPLILRRLLHLQRLNLKYSEELPFQPSRLSDAMKMSLYTIARLPSFIYLDLEFVWDIALLLRHYFSDLRNIGLSKISSRGQSRALNPVEAYARNRRQLNSLSLSFIKWANVSKLFLGPKSLLDISLLYELHVHAIAPSDFEKLSTTCGPSLKSLTFDTRNESMSLPFQFCAL